MPKKNEELEKLLKDNPNYYVSPQDLALAQQNPDFAQALIGSKSLWYGTDDPNTRARANRDLEAARILYGGYTAGSEGKEYNPLYTPTAAPAIEAPAPYVSPYSSAIDALLNNITNVQPFNYDPTTDPLYGQIKKTQLRESQRAMEDTLGQVATMTGGLPSSAAVSAASQARDYHLAKLGDALPQLQQLAYAMYRDQIGDKYNQMNLLRGLENEAYGKYRDTVGDYRYEREYADDQAWRDREWQNLLAQQYLGEQRYQDETEYERGEREREWEYRTERDAIEDERYEREYGDRVAQQEYENNLAWQKVYGGDDGETSEDFTEQQLLNYGNVYTKLMKDKTPEEAIAYINRVGADRYIDLMGEELFRQMLIDIMNTEPAAPVKPDTYGAIYSAMMSSGDPEAWLTDNAPYLTNDELKYILSVLENMGFGGGAYGNLG